MLFSLVHGATPGGDLSALCRAGVKAKAEPGRGTNPSRDGAVGETGQRLRCGSTLGADAGAPRGTEPIGAHDEKTQRCWHTGHLKPKGTWGRGFSTHIYWTDTIFLLDLHPSVSSCRMV